MHPLTCSTRPFSSLGYGAQKNDAVPQGLIERFMAGIRTAIVIRDGLCEGSRIDPQSAVHHLLGDGGRLVEQEIDVREPTLALHQHSESIRPVTRHNHIGFPMPTLLSRGRGPRAQLNAGSVLDSLGGLPIGPLRFPLEMMAGQQTNPFRLDTIHVLIHGFVTHGGQLTLVLEPPRDQFRSPAHLSFLMHIFPDRLRFESGALHTLLETPLCHELGPSRKIVLPTPELPSPFATDAGMASP